MGPSGSEGRQAGIEGERKGMDLSVGVCYSSTEKGTDVIAAALCFLTFAACNLSKILRIV